MERIELKRPPIKEAILDVIFEDGFSTTIFEIEEYQKIILDRFPNKLKIVQGQFNFSLGKPDSTASTDQIGISHSTADNKLTIQTSINEFSFIQRNQSYKVWDHFFDDAFKSLMHYCDFIKCRKAKRISLRYVNEFEIPLPVVNTKDYLLTGIDLPDDLIVGIINGFTRFEIFSSKYNSLGIVSQIVKIPNDDFLSVIFDIDVIKENIDGEEYFIDDKIRDYFNSLREFKNEIFFKSITQKLLELID